MRTMLATFVLGAVVIACGRRDARPSVDTATAFGAVAPEAARPARTGGADPVVTGADVELLRRHKLIMPVAGVAAGELLDTFRDRRGNRMHGALDIPAPRGTPVLSADNGRVLKLHTSRGGGLTVYVADPTERFVYFYAHLDGYREGLAEGQLVHKGDVLGYVGTTGNAPPNLPHLHFAITRTEDVRKWWRGTPIDPLPILRAGG
jgi:murein DD-endopeptidase MepM/ murein hydrolase activator NlpD